MGPEWRTFAAAALVGGLLLTGVPAAAPSRAEPSAVGPVLTVAAAPPRLAFTDDRDELTRFVVTRTRTSDDPPSDRFRTTDYSAYRPNSGRHTGEAGATASGPVVYVSTENDDPDGEVRFDRGDGTARTLTCDSATESHPALSPDGRRVAYAAASEDGFDLWLVEVPESDDVPCEELGRTRLTSGAGDDLWPAWLPNGSGIVFSSTRADPLGDLYLLHSTPPNGSDPVAEEIWTLEQLTDGPDADTQPAAHDILEQTVVAFTTTRFRPDGSIGVIRLDGGSAEPRSAWSTPVQSTEPAWSPDGSYLSFSTARDDPYGDVAAVPVVDANEPLDPAGVFPVAAAPGRTESHSSWQTDFDNPTGTEGGIATEASILVTRHSHRAAVADEAVAGGDRRRIAVGRPDAAGPAWSSDGTRLAYSRAGFTARDAGRRLVVARSDGSAATTPDTTWRAGDTDVDPAWSPDGTRIAFTRVRRTADGVSTTIRILDLDTGRAAALPLPPGAQDESPTWSPDGRWLGFARSTDPPPPPSATPTPTPSVSSPPPPPVLNAVFPRVSRGSPAAPDETEKTLWIAEAASGSARQLGTTGPGCAGGACPVPGRSPAWSPDGRTLAFVTTGQIDVLALPTDGTLEAGGAAPLNVGTPTAVTGFRADRSPTPSRAVLAAAADPAWAPDGSELVFAGQPAGRPDGPGVHAVRPDGTGLRSVADLPGPETEPAPQPYADLRVSLAARPGAVLSGQASTVTAVVTNQGPAPAAAVRLVLRTDLTLQVVAGCVPAPGQLTCTWPELASGSAVEVVVSARGVGAGVHPVTASTDASTPDPSAADNTADTSIGVFPPQADLSVEIDVVGSPPTLTFTVRNHGPQIAAAVQLRTEYPGTERPAAVTPAPGCRPDGSGCSFGSLFPNGVATYVVALSNSARPAAAKVRARVTAVTADPDQRNNTSTAELGATPPRLWVLPAVAPPGRVTLAYGENFPPGAEVTLRWTTVDGATTGVITTDPGPYRAAADGTLRIPMLIIRRDRLGSRLLAATPAGEASFAAVSTPMLVIPPTLRPPRFLGRS